MTSCPQCEISNPVEETYCIACGSALDGRIALESLPLLPVGAVLADTYVIESNEECTFENRYRAVRIDSADARVVLRERSIEEVGILSALAEQAASLTHPALVLPERFFVQEDRAYLAVPDIAGTRLSVRVGLTSEREAILWGIQLCQIAATLHRTGLLCIELPPEGVLLDKEGRIRLTHCESLSRKAEPLTLSAITDGYAAPEVYKAGDVGEQADVFAIGALLFSLVVGKRLPVEGWIVHPDPPIFYPEKVVSPHFERVLRKALAIDPQSRYESVDAFKAALVALQASSRTHSAWLTDVGQVRDHNEDAVLVKEYGQGTIAGNVSAGLYVIADGMGGAEAGEVASTLTIQTIAAHIERVWRENSFSERTTRESCLREAIEEANAAILAYAQQHPESAGLGSTVVAALVQDQQLTLAWVGDSRAYLWDRGLFQQLSHDHSLVARLVEIGQLSPEEARTHEHRNVLIRSLGSKDQVTVDEMSCPWRRGARLLLCSDGLTGHVEDGALSDILNRHREPYEAALELVAAANADGGNDNISLVVVFHE